MTTVEERLSRLEGSYEQIAERLNDLNQTVQGVDRKVDTLRSDIDTRFDSLRSGMDARFLALDGKLDEMNRNHRNFTYIIYAIGTGMWATILVVGVMLWQNGGG